MSSQSVKNLYEKWGFPIIGGLLFLIIFYYAYSKINPDYYTLRDDGIITLSHAKNWVDFGFIGVGPSGERIEGYSAPVQFFIYALIYLVTGAGFSAYVKAQTLICTFALGFIFTLFFKEKKYSSLIVSAIAALLLTQMTSFIQWHGSGMENAITHVLFALTAYLLFKFVRDREIDLRLAFIPFLASLSRLDGIYHIFPLLLLFAIYWTVFEKNKKGSIFLALSMLLWLAYNAWRFFYFGDLNPNTAYAQDISISQRIISQLGLDLSTLKSSVVLSRTILSAHGGFYLFLLVPLLKFVQWKKNYRFLFVISLSVIFTAWFNPFLFGPTRLDTTRSTTQMAFFAVLAIICVVDSLNKEKAWRRLLFIIPAAITIYCIGYIPPYSMCCGIKAFDATRQEFAKIAHEEDLPRPTISNPDLGVMSWHKQFNIVDLGMLGSQIMAKLKNGPAMADYFFEYAAPDMIESHGAWSCQYLESIFSDPRFRQMYVPVREEIGHSKFCGEKNLPVGVWVRKDILKHSTSDERHLIDALRLNLSTERLKKELAVCQSNAKKSNSCVYVARTAYRFLPELRQSGKIEALLDIFSTSKTKEFDQFLITGFRDVKANEKAIKYIQDNLFSDSK